jgi:dolichyl-phosphate-mannose--protein O-mannosyl transferase
MAVRISTLVLSLVGVLGVYVLIRQLNRPRWLAMICALTLCFNPVYFSLSNTFMTDVPFAAWEILTSLFFCSLFANAKEFRLVHRHNPGDYRAANPSAWFGNPDGIRGGVFVQKRLSKTFMVAGVVANYSGGGNTDRLQSLDESKRPSGW